MENGCLGMSDCGMCDTLFSYDPARVPTFPLDRSQERGIPRLKSTASKEPVCISCFDLINRFREKHGESPLPRNPAWWAKDE